MLIDDGDSRDLTKDRSTTQKQHEIVHGPLCPAMEASLGTSGPVSWQALQRAGISRLSSGCCHVEGIVKRASDCNYHDFQSVLLFQLNHSTYFPQDVSRTRAAIVQAAI